MESRICGKASLDVYETGWRGKLGLRKISGPMHYHFNHFTKVLGEMHIFWDCFCYFGPLIGASGVTFVWRGIPECGGDGMKWPFGSG